ncbi:hypothetical protein FNL39_1035 [Nocardia caishijiensis]|uniref:Uncharacterized protein n=2 Tax=Nocardia caishijiensis TaxID=184756 RepID=A0ABQ6YMU2_9NOCA|nr:hypothetical protein FNL39_1035 [Nocardia caishijiensis]
MAQLQHRIAEMTDDSGFLGLVDPHAYTSFVGEDWTLEMLFGRFEAEIRQRTMLLWGTGGEERWRIDLLDSPVDPRLPVIRQITGPITVTGGELIVVNLETVTMAAQYADSAVDDDKDIYGSGIALPNGDYICTVSQLTDPEEDRTHDGPDFHLHLTAGHTPPWSGVAWSEL